MRNYIKKQLTNIFTIIFCVITFAAIGKAQLVTRLAFETSFDFIVGEQTFPAGKYTIERLNQTDSRVLVLREVGGDLKTIFLTNPMINEKQIEQSQIIFNKHIEGYFLSRIWVSGDPYGYRSLLNKDEQEMR